MKRIAENRALAWCVLAVVVAASILLSGGGALKEARAHAQAVYYADLGIDYDLRARVEEAGHVAAVARDYDQIDAALIDAVDAAREDLLTADNAADAYPRNQILADAVEALEQALTKASMAEDDELYARKALKEFKSRAATIAHSDYNRVAAEYNDVYERFPASLIGRLFGVTPLELFQ